MKKTLIFILTFVLLISLFQYPVVGQEDQACLVDQKLAPILVSEISGERTLDYITKISRFHRIRGGGPGSGYNDAVDYVVSELEKFNLDDVHVDRFKSDGITSYLHWRSPIGWRVKSAKLWLIEPQNELIADFSNVAASLMAYSNSGQNEAEVVYVGEGRSDKDYRGIDVKGKIVFATGGFINDVHLLAVFERGAVGMVVGPSNRDDRLEYPDLVELKRLYFKSEEKNKAAWGFSLSRRQTNQLLRLFSAGIKVRMKAEVNAELFDGEMPIVSALIKGKTFPEKEILIMGHLDHYKPGANDNASGCAGMMEIAGVISDLIQTGKIKRPHRSLRFLWVPEMHGTMAYLDKHKNVDDYTLVGINLDMIGEHYEKCKSHLVMTRPPYSSPSYLGDVMRDMFNWVDGLNIYSERGSQMWQNIRDVGYSGGSDHYIFTDPSIGVPSLMLNHSDVFHHTSYDTPDKCDPTVLRRVVTAAAMAAITIANSVDQNAVDIAAHVAQCGLDRLHQRSRKSMALLRSFSEKDNFSQEASNLFRKILSYTEIVGEVEQSAIQSCAELCQDRKAKSTIDQIAKSLESDIKTEKKRLAKYFEYIYSNKNVEISPSRLTDIEKQALKIVPKRLFRGPLPRDILVEKLGNRYLWYQKNASLIGGDLGNKTYEITNLINGKRNLLWIRDAVSAQFGETGMEFVLHYVEDLRSLNLVSW